MKLRAKRKHRRLTQQMLAARSGVSLDALRKLEQGLRKPLHETVLDLARALEVDVNYFGGRLKPKDAPQEAAQQS